MRARFIEELAKEGVRVALPVGLSEFDVLAYSTGPTDNLLLGVPIKVVSAPYEVVLSNLAEIKCPVLLAVLIQESEERESLRSFAFTPEELVVARMIGVIERSSNRPRGSDTFRRALERHAVSPGTWHNKIRALIRPSVPQYSH